MGFQVPPTLPDYSKLIAVLNGSNVQKWNPPLFQILTQLIQAAMQGQAILQSNTTNITNAATVLVDPAGAILGDGQGTPLKVNVDGITIQIVADALTAIPSGINVLSAGFSIVLADMINLNSAPVTLVPAVPSKVLFPIFIYVHTRQIRSFGSSVQGFVQYSSINVNITGGMNVILGGTTSGTAFDYYTAAAHNAAVQYPNPASPTPFVSIVGKALVLKGSNNTTVGGAAPPDINQLDGVIVYGAL